MDSGINACRPPMACRKSPNPFVGAVENVAAGVVEQR